MLKELSVFFPAYNEQDNIKKTIIDAVKVLKKVTKKYEIIVVDDGSKDNTALIVNQLIVREPRLRLVSHRPNRGYGAAIKTGLSQAKYDLICYTDSDGQFNFSEITKFIAHIESGADLVVGYRINRTDNPYRRFMAQLLRLAGIFLFSINIKDVDCGFKVVRAAVYRQVQPLLTSSAITETELVAKIKRAGFKIAQVGVKHRSRKGGEQTGGKPSVIIKAALEGIKLWLSL